LKLFRGFLSGFGANAELVPKIHVALHASHETVPKIDFKIFAKRSSPKAMKTLS
jgi:hypothetical protein